MTHARTGRLRAALACAAVVGTVVLSRCARAEPAPARGPERTRPSAPVVSTAARAAPSAPSAPDVPSATGWHEIGAGVAARRTGAARGSNALVVLAGWRITDDNARAWGDALYEARLRERGVGAIYAARGPADVDHRSHDLGVAALADALMAQATPATQAVLVVAHSSGALVAAELFYRLFRARSDGGAALRDRVLFVSLDGDADVVHDPLGRLEPATVGALRRAWFVTARDVPRDRGALANATARAQHARYPARSDFLEYDARDSGCARAICVHLSLVNPHPFARGNESYARYGAEGPNVFWFDSVAARWER